jgi:hypothetical protein
MDYEYLTNQVKALQKELAEDVVPRVVWQADKNGSDDKNRHEDELH